MQELTTNETAASILEAIEADQPLSLIRLGDGEAIILGYPEFYPSNRFMKQMWRWFGEHAKELSKFTPLRPLLETAIRNADIIGMPTPIDDMETARAWLQRPLDVTEEEKKLTSRMSFGLLPHLTKPLLSHQKLTKFAINGDLLKEGFFDRLLIRLQRVTVISCNNVSQALHSINSALRITHIHVPGQAIKEGDRLPEWRKLEPHFPVAYERVCMQLQRGDYDNPVLVGAGPLGKVYCDEVKRSGGVGIDIGSIMDIWAGRVTRGYMLQERFRSTVPAPMSHLLAQFKTEREHSSKLRAELKAKRDDSSKLKAELKKERQRTSKRRAEFKAERERSSKLRAELKTKREHSSKLRAELKAERERSSKRRAEFKAERERSSKLSAELKTKRDQSSKLSAKLKAERERSAKLRAELNTKRDRSSKLSAKLKAERERSAKLRAELNTKRDHSSKLSAKLKAERERSSKLNKKLMKMLHSSSWRLTKPIRGLHPVTPLRPRPPPFVPMRGMERGA